jgi:hypothetical protein
VVEGSALGTIDVIAGALVVARREFVGVTISAEVVVIDPEADVSTAEVAVDPPPVTVIVPRPSPAL